MSITKSAPVQQQDPVARMDIHITITFPSDFDSSTPLRLGDLKRMTDAFTSAGVPDNAALDLTHNDKGFSVEVFS